MTSNYSIVYYTDSKQSPIYVREHSKRQLMNALLNDTQFLAKHIVMDYSLLCGYDEDTKELVIGIIGMVLISLH